MDEYVELNLRGGDGGTEVALKCLKSTAEHFGWLEALGRAHGGGPIVTLNGQRYRRSAYCPRKHTGGKPMRICLSDSRDGHPAGETKRFRVNAGTTDKDLAYLASVTKVPFGWMTSIGMRRISRDEWLDRYAAWEAA
jgi:hypothetical protein